MSIDDLFTKNMDQEPKLEFPIIEAILKKKCKQSSGLPDSMWYSETDESKLF